MNVVTGRSRLLILLAASAVLAGRAVGAEPLDDVAASEADRAAISGCLRESADAPRACVGAVAVVCARQTGGDRRDAEIACSRREAAVWRERLDMAARVLAPRLEAGARSRLAAVQRSWETYAAQKCAFVADVQPAPRAPTMQAGCELSEVAARAIELERLVRRQAEAREPRPRLER
jgi:uncharacterized protein YecT (DUF1311 family)